jgi:arylsulfatase A-like enzyme
VLPSWIGGCDDPERRPVPGPNVILVVVDTLRADHLTQYGYDRDTSSVLSRLTESATRFEECYSPAPWTAPAVASIFTGLGPASHRVDAVGAALATNATTLAERLRSAGFHTAAVAFNPHITRRAHFDQGFDEFLSYRGLARRAPDIRYLAREARRFTLKARKPFFLYLQPMNVHGPYAVPDDARSILLGRPPAAGFEFFGPVMKELMNGGRLERRSDVTPEFLSSLEEHYDTAIRHTSEELAAFFDHLHEVGLWDDSLVVVTADHGEELFDHGGFAHRYSLHREVLHVPLFVKLPGQRQARTIREPVSLVDLPATILDLLDLPRLPGDGRSLAPFLAGPEEDVDPTLRNRPILARASNPKRFEGRSLRRGRYELIVIDRNYEGVENEVRLYDLTSDPDQQHDRAADEPALVARMQGELRAIEESRRKDAHPKTRYELSPEERADLEALGYF